MLKYLVSQHRNGENILCTNSNHGYLLHMSRCMIPSIQVLAIEDEKLLCAEEERLMVLLSPPLLSSAASATRPGVFHSCSAHIDHYSYVLSPTLTQPVTNLSIEWLCKQTGNSSLSRIFATPSRCSRCYLCSTAMSVSPISEA